MIKHYEPCLCGSGLKWKKCCGEGGVKNIAVLIGNGINFSLKDFLQNEEYNSSNFFSWDIKTPEKEEELFLDNLPQLKEELNLLNLVDLSDFEKIEKIIVKQNKIIKENEVEIKDFNWNNESHVEKRNKNNKAMLCLLECRHYLAIAFSTYQLKINKENLQEWEWNTWFVKHKHLIKHCVTLNYDLVLEKIFGDNNISFRRTGELLKNNGISIHKPHGSIDFDCPDNAIKIENEKYRYPIRIAINRADTPLKVIEEKELLKPRILAEIVLPTEQSDRMSFQWIIEGYKRVKLISNQIKKIVIVGISYWDVDQHEIDFILNSLSEEAEVYFVNPFPDKHPTNKLVEKLEKKFKRVELCRDYIPYFY